MHRTLGRFSGTFYALLRIFAGFMFLQHGAQKLFGAFGAEKSVEFLSRAGLAGVIELGCGLLIMVGLYTSWAAFLASGTMAAAYFIAHAPRGFWTVQNRGELAVLYCFVFLYLASKGDGEWSLAKMLGKSRP
jgi:putative oxidoreductase